MLQYYYILQFAFNPYCHFYLDLKGESNQDKFHYCLQVHQFLNSYFLINETIVICLNIKLF